MPRFLHYFDYEDVEITNGGTYYLNVKFLTSLGDYRPGDKADIININMKFCIWEDNSLVDTICVKH